METETSEAPHTHFRLLNRYPVHTGQHYWKWCGGCHAYVCRHCGSPRISSALWWEPFDPTYTYDPFRN
jgi:hypothetical protein